jgi:hypothetical protein
VRRRARRDGKALLGLLVEAGLVVDTATIATTVHALQLLERGAARGG